MPLTERLGLSKKVLILGSAWIGDMIMAQSLFMFLKQRFPQIIIDTLVPAWSLPLIKRMPEVRKGILMPIGHGKLNLWQRFLLAKSLRKECYDQAIILPNSWKSALIPWWAKIPKRRGFRGEMRYGLLNELRLLDKKKLPLMVQRFVSLGLETGECLPDPVARPTLLSNKNSVTQSLKTMGLAYPCNKLLVLCPGAEFGASKRWPAVYFAAVAKEKMLAGWDVWLFGSRKDDAIGADIIGHLQGLGGKVQCLIGRTSLEQAIDLMSLATIVVSNDSGLMHVAAALNRDLVAIYGSSDANHTPPLLERSRILHLNLACRPCHQPICPLGHYRCLTELKPSRVLDAIESFSAGLLC